MTPWGLYWLFFKFGLLCFGGGYMLVPLLTADLVERRHLLSGQEFANLVSIAQATPGPIGINTATYVGFEQFGVIGSLAATFGVVTPAAVLVIVAIKLLKRWEPSLPVQGFLTGMRPAAFGLVLAAAVIFAELSVFSGPIPWSFAPEAWETFGIRPAALAIAVATVWIMLKSRISFMYLLLASALIGAFLC